MNDPSPLEQQIKYEKFFIKKISKSIESIKFKNNLFINFEKSILNKIINLTINDFSNNKVISNKFIKISKTKIKINFIFYILYFLELSILFFIYSFLLIFSFSNLNKKKYSKKKFIIFLDNPSSNNNYSLGSFISSGKLSKINSFKSCVVISKYPVFSKYKNKVFFSRFPLLYLASNFLSFSNRLLILKDILLNIHLIFYYLIKNPVLILLRRELIDIFLINFLDNKNIINKVFMTNSNLFDPPLWTYKNNKNFTNHCIWYSQNIFPKIYDRDKKLFFVFLNFRNLNIDQHYVWTKEFKTILINNGIKGKFKEIGPFQWLYPQKKININEDYIVLFDVIPLNIETNLFYSKRNYYSYATITKFIEDSVNIINELNIKYNLNINVILKHKRNFNKYHDTNYSSFISSFSKKYKFFKIISPYVDNEYLIKNSITYLSVPYSTTAYYGEFLKKTNFFYDSSGSVLPLFPNDPYIHFTNNKKQLYKLLEKVIISKSKR